MDKTERLIRGILRRAQADWRGGYDLAIGEFIDAGRYHGVLPLLDAAFRDRTDSGTWPSEILSACHNAALFQAMFELAHRAEIGRVLEALVSVGVAPLLLKGTALAYSHYRNPTLRPRADTDLLIPRELQNETEHALAGLGYVRRMGVRGEHISSQGTWSRTDHLAATHNLDIHWRINNSPILSKALDYDELFGRAVLVPALGPRAYTLDPVHALLFACIHRAGHANAPYHIDRVAHLGGDRLIWLYDIHLLVASMSAGELAEFAALAASKGIKAICITALQRTHECFATPIPAHVSEVLSLPGPIEPSARYLSGGRARQMLGDFLAFDSWNDRAAWVKENVFPPADYMRTKYSDAANTWLPLLYARRALTGVAQLIFARDAGHRH